MIKTMAVKITEETFPVAVACLGTGFATTNLECTMGAHLVINDYLYPERQPEYDVPSPMRNAFVRQAGPRAIPSRRENALVLHNFWTSKSEFKKHFKIVGDATDKTEFFEVTRR